MDGPTDILCRSCHSFFGKYHCRGERNFEHETGSLSDLETSAQNGCPLCGIIVASIVVKTQALLGLLRSEPSPIKLSVSSSSPRLVSVASGKWSGSVTIGITQAPVEEVICKNVLQDPYLLQWELRDQTYRLVHNHDDKLEQAEYTTQWETYCTQRDGANMSRKICDLTTDTGQQEVAETVKQWLATCCSLHKQCGALQDRHLGLPPLPTRVLDIGTLEQPYLRLHISGNDEREEYTCLSYCWGRGVPEFKTRVATVDDLRNHIPFLELPKTIQDAIVFTRRLHVRYLWVDALCIIQDDTSNPSDWQLEAARFSTYYQNALCTLAASGSHDSSEGLFRPSFDRIYPTYLCTRLNRGSKEPLYYTWVPWVSNTAELVSEAPLAMRGWAAQEKILSPRIVHFTCRYVIWDCTQLFASERSPDQDVRTGSYEPLYELRSGFSKRDTKMYQPTGSWASLCNWYVKKKFTRLSDRLPALSGVAQRIQGHTGKKFYAGLWEGDIVEGLDWYVHNPESIPGSQVLAGPSWSWIHATGELCCRSLNWMETTSFPVNISTTETRVLGIKVQETGHGIDGSTTSGVITISGMLSTLNLAELGYKQYRAWGDRAWWVMDGDDHDAAIHWDRLPLEVEAHGTYDCLQLGKFTPTLEGQVEREVVRALILVLVSNDTSGTPVFRRVGHGRFWQDVWNGGKPGWKVVKLV